MFNLKSIAIAVALSASALVSTAPGAVARDKVIVIEQSQRPHHARNDRRNDVRDHRAARRAEARRAEARRDRRHDRRMDRRHDRRNNGAVIVLKNR